MFRILLYIAACFIVPYRGLRGRCLYCGGKKTGVQFYSNRTQLNYCPRHPLID